MKPSLATLRDPIMCLALGFGSGLWRKGPGTMGSLVGVVLFLPLIDASMVVKVSLIFVGSVLGVYICEYAAKELKLSDPGCVVWDE
ncbi:MAG: phosphatidylglycerophosphatase A, partial [Pseudomonadales bacterium]